MDKRHIGRFCIQFSSADSRHLQVVELLEAQGRRKAQFIADAVLHYINCKESPDTDTRPEPDAAMFKARVAAIVREIMRQEQSVRPIAESDASDAAVKLPVADVISADVRGEVLDEDLFASIRESISTLRDNEPDEY